ncbi:MAG: protoporphyrinogen oxidase [Bacteroidales bacterium]|nr:protoporphyrinogen oxidase [Bacteroidales bacterium]
MEANDNYQAIVIGGGLTGLVIGFYLKKAGINFRIIEKSNRPGGVIQTFKEEGFTYEAGPNTAVLSHPEVKELFEALGDACELEIADEEAKRRLIWKDGQWHALPSGLIEGVTTPLFSFSDKIKLLGEPFRKPGDNPHEPLSGMVKRRMGQSFLDYAVDPFILGIYAGDPDYLIPKYALPKLYNLEQNYGSFIGGAIKKRKEPKDEREQKATRDVFSVKGGLENLIHALVDAIGEENIILNAGDVTVNPSEDGYEVSYRNKQKEKIHLKSRQVVSATGSYEIPGILPFVSKELIHAINNLKYARVAEMSLGFKNWGGMELNAFGGLVPSKENRQILGALFLSSFLKNRAPEGGAMISVFTGGYRKPDMAKLTDEELTQIVEKEVKEMLKLDSFNPDILRIFRYEYAIPQYGAGSLERLEAVKKTQQQYPGLIIAGNLRDGIGMADRIKQGYEVAQEISKLA